ncbi:MAG: hypothetical protein R2704_10500 [Microthrixaceae bacterium]
MTSSQDDRHDRHEATADETAGAAADGSTCQNCGSADVGTDPVHRVYLSPEAPEDVDAAIIADEIERWCAACLANYPHQPVTAG